MPGLLAAHLVRRGLDAVKELPPTPATSLTTVVENPLLSTGSLILLSCTAVTFLVAALSAAYVLTVIENMTAVEHIQPRNYDLVPSELEAEETAEGVRLLDRDAPGFADEAAPGHTNIPKKPITRGLRTSLRHLYSIGGLKSLFRGLLPSAIYIFALSLISAPLSFPLRPVTGGEYISAVFGLVVTCCLHCMWTQATIRAPRTSSSSTSESSPTLRLVSSNDTFEDKTIEIPFYPDSVRIGRQVDGTMCKETNGYFNSPVLSEAHAEICAEPNGTLWIKDTGSVHGTFINGKRLSDTGKVSESHQLEEGDSLGFGADIAGSDKKTTAHKQLAGYVEKAGIYNQKGALLTRSADDASRIKSAWKRAVPHGQSLHLLLPAFRVALAVTVLEYLFITALNAAQDMALARIGRIHFATVLALYHLILLAYFIGILLLGTPLEIALIRIEASLLPETAKVIVPFDRTFGGRVDLSRSQSWIQYLVYYGSPYGAFKTFDFQTLRRMWVLAAKTMCILYGIFAFFGLIFFLECHFITKGQLGFVIYALAGLDVQG